MIAEVLNRRFVLEQLKLVRRYLADGIPDERRSIDLPFEADPEKYRLAEKVVRAAIQVKAASSSAQKRSKPMPSARRGQDIAPIDNLAFFSHDPIQSLMQTSLEEYFREIAPDKLQQQSIRSDRRGAAGAGNSLITDVSIASWEQPSGNDEINRRILGAMSETDPRWLACWMAEGIRLFTKKHAFNDKPAEPFKIGDKARLVLVGDWGSGIPRAVKVAAQMRKVIDEGKKNRVEQHVVHLGDVYYSGWATEYDKRFLEYWPVRADEANEITSWCLNGNHDMYSGGHAYFDHLLADPRFARQQKSSFFSMFNGSWQILGLDTAYDDAGLKSPQPAWVKQTLSSDPRRSMLLSHHQLFSAYEKGSPTLEKKLKDFLKNDGVDCWFWGHEHRCVFYSPYKNVRDARLIGHGGVPVYQFHPKNAAIKKPAFYEYRDFLTASLGAEHFALFGFAVVDFDGPRIHVRYIDEDGKEHFKEDLPTLSTPTSTPKPPATATSTPKPAPTPKPKPKLGLPPVPIALGVDFGGRRGGESTLLGHPGIGIGLLPSKPKGWLRPIMGSPGPRSGGLGGFRTGSGTLRKVAPRKSSKKTTKKTFKKKSNGSGGWPARVPGPKLSTKRPVADDTIRRTPHLDLPDQPLALNRKFTVAVYADTAKARAGEKSEDISIEKEKGRKSYPVSVSLVATNHFTILNPQPQTMWIKTDEEASERIEFDIKTNAKVQQPQRASISAMFTYRGRASGRVTRQVQLDAIAKPAHSSPDSNPPLPARLAPKNAFAFSNLDHAPDLTIAIFDPDNTLRSFEFEISTPRLDDYKSAKRVKWNLNDKTSDIVTGFFKDFVDASDQDQRLDGLRGAGISLFDLAPDEFKKVYWRLIDSGKPFQTISIVSDDPYIPWELMLPRRAGQRPPENALPLGMEHTVARWLRNDYRLPNQMLRLERSCIFAPKYLGPKPSPLKYSQQEVGVVASAFPAKHIVPATYAEFRNTMKSGGASVLHFICHGATSTATAQCIYMEAPPGGIMSSTQVTGMAVLSEAFEKARPLIFLNACEVGRTIPSLVGVGGFAKAFLDAGASCVIAPLWSVADSVALDVATRFYKAISKNKSVPLASVLRQIRRLAYEGKTAGVDSYAAYCFYGDPLAARG